MHNEISQAIRDHLVLEFRYDGHSRIVSPAAYGETSTGKPALRGYQTGGTSSTGAVPDWKLFTVDKITQLTVTTAVFATPPGYQRGDRGLRRIYVEL